MRTALLMCTLSCASPRIEGQVVDNAGQGIQGVTVSAEDIAQSVLTDANGRYVMELPPGQQNLTFSHPAYFSQAEALHVAPDEATALPRRTLIKTPDGGGLHVLSGAEVLPLPAARLKRETRTADGSKLRSYCVAGPKSSTASIPAGQAQFVDMSSSSWRLFKLDSDGCAYRDQKDSNGRWVVRYRNKPTVKPIPSQAKAAFAAATLEEGTYFVADWGGFFVPDPEEPDHYTGRLLRIDG